MGFYVIYAVQTQIEKYQLSQAAHNSNIFFFICYYNKNYIKTENN